jgi:hypothetical protein
MQLKDFLVAKLITIVFKSQIVITNWRFFTSVLIQHEEEVHNPIGYDPWPP